MTTMETSPIQTSPLPPFAEGILSRLVLAFAERIVANFDHYGTLWGFSLVEEAEREIAEERAEGAVINEWETVDRDGQPLRVVRVTHLTFGTDIRVFSTWSPYAKAVAA